mmetsp:Transcript_6953/g.8428  ORF Transcript_6953/g.8428 Transcript_6953/m.8428 type:complete len:258 (+) Transcript_6953:107-880(+)
MSVVTKFFVDPMAFFAIGTLVSVLFLEGNLESKSLLLKNPIQADEAFEYFSASPMLFGYAVLIATLVTVETCHTVSKSDQKRASWFLWNAVVFHIMMDGCSGGLNTPRLMGANYRILDNRFRFNVSLSEGGPHPGEAAGGFTVVMVELLIMAPLCILTCVGIMKNLPWHHELQAVVSAFHLFGTIMFIAPEFLTSCPNMAPIGEETCLPDLTPFTFFYFYFGVGANLVWILVPLYIGFTAVLQSVSVKKVARKQKVQ